MHLNNAITLATHSVDRGRYESVLGVYDGQAAKSRKHGYLKLAGEDFWDFICNNRGIGAEIMEMLDRRSMEHDDDFVDLKARVTGQLTMLFINQLCTDEGTVDWARLVQTARMKADLIAS